MPKWKWHKQLREENVQKEKLIQREKKESLKFFTSEEKRNLRKKYRFSILALLFALLPLILLIIFILSCMIKGVCPNIGRPMTSEEVYYSDPLR